MSNRKQRVLLNGQNSSWINVHARVPQGSILVLLLFLIYINDLAEDLFSDLIFFADDTSLLSVVYNINASARELNDDLKKFNNWAVQCTMSFNPDPSKEAQENTFCRKIKKLPHSSLVFNNNNVWQTSCQKHLGVSLDVKLTFGEHLNNVLKEVNKTISLLRKLPNLSSRSTLITIYKVFVRPYLDYGDILFDQTYNSSFHEILESIQYNACLALTRTIRGSSKEKIYQELGFESLRVHHWYRKLCLFYKILNN